MSQNNNPDTNTRKAADDADRRRRDEEAKGALALTKADAIKKIHEYLASRKTELISALGEQKKPLILACISGVMAVLQKSEKPRTGDGIALWQCFPSTIATAIRDSIQHGIPIDGRGLGYLTRAGLEAGFAPGYKGYINRVSEYNPSVDFQVGLVFRDEPFEVDSKDGVDSYSHKVLVPFPQKDDFDKRLVGAYCYLSYEKSGRFYAKLQRLSEEDIIKIRSKAKTKAVWDEWFSEQILKSVVRRSCKIPFATVVNKLDEIDNESFDMEQPTPTPAGSTAGSKGATASWKDALNKEEEKRKEEENTIDGEAKVVSTSGFSSSFEEEKPEVNASEAVVDMVKPEKKTIQIQIPYLPEEAMPILTFTNVFEAAAELESAMLSTEDKSERLQLIEANSPLFTALLKEKDKKSAMAMMDKLHGLPFKIEGE